MSRKHYDLNMQKNGHKRPTSMSEAKLEHKSGTRYDALQLGQDDNC